MAAYVEPDGMAIMASAIAAAILGKSPGGTLTQAASVADMLWAIQNGSLTNAELQALVDLVGTFFIAPP